MMGQIRKSWLLIVVANLALVACASQPPAPPPRPMTHEEWVAQREQLIQKAVRSSYLAGEDGTAVYERLELKACYDDAMALTDVAQRSPAVQQCRVTWPQPVQQTQQQVTTNCYSQGGVTQCTSR
jgi:hypothetical protein